MEAGDDAAALEASCTRNLYRRGDVDAVTVRHLPLASRQQQRDWLALWDNPDTREPTGSQVKAGPLVVSPFSMATGPKL